MKKEIAKKLVGMEFQAVRDRRLIIGDTHYKKFLWRVGDTLRIAGCIDREDGDLEMLVTTEYSPDWEPVMASQLESEMAIYATDIPSDRHSITTLRGIMIA